MPVRCGPGNPTASTRNITISFEFGAVQDQTANMMQLQVCIIGMGYDMYMRAWLSQILFCFKSVYVICWGGGPPVNY